MRKEVEVTRIKEEKKKERKTKKKDKRKGQIVFFEEKL